MKSTTPPVVAAALSLFTAAAMSASGATINLSFLVIPSDPPPAGLVLTGTIEDDLVNGGVFITISNTSFGDASGSSVHEIYFNSGAATVLGATATDKDDYIYDFSAGVNMSSATVSPPDLPGNNGVIGGWTLSFGYDTVGNQADGVGAGEFIKFYFPDAPEITGNDYSSLLIGLHTGAVDAQGNSLSLVNTPPENIPVPEPTAASLAGLAGAMLLLRRRRI